MFKFKKNFLKEFDFILFGITITLCTFGLLMIFSSTLSFEHTSHVKTQGMATLIGIICMVILLSIDYEIIGKLSIPIYVISNLLLIAVLIMGSGGEQWGAGRWIIIGPISFQPSEFIKIGLVISLARFIDDNKETINEPVTLLKILGFAFLPVTLIAIQPDLGTALVFVFFIIVMLFMAGVKFKYFLYTMGIGILSLPIIWFNLGSYQKGRIFDFIEPERDLQGSSYQVMQGRIAIGSGKVFGRGLFKGVQTQYNYIPEKHTDFIFAVIAEELGFIGGLLLIMCYSILLYRFIKIAKKSKDLFGSLIVMGYTAIFLFHIWQNIGMTIGLMPVTGIPLPFMSYGGTFQLTNLICVGIVLSVGVSKKELSF